MNDDNHTDTNAVAPTSLRHLVGQDSVKAQIAVALESAWADTTKFENSCLVGPPGCGKSATANVIAAEMGVADTFTEVLGQSITNVADLNALLLGAQERTVVHIDEAHEMSKPLQTALYLALDKRRVFINSSRKGSAPQGISIADFTLLLSSTDEYCLLQPLRERMRLTLRFQFYSVEELREITRQRSQALRWPVHEEVFPLVAERAKGTPRLALKLLQAARRCCRAEGETEITIDHLHRACTLEQVDCLGLDVTQQQYLKLLDDSSCRLNILASSLGLPARTVSQVTEPFLIRAGLIAKDDQGRRHLTAAGRDHVARGEEQ